MTTSPANFFLWRDLFWGYVRRYFLLFILGIAAGLIIFMILRPLVTPGTKTPRRNIIGLVGNFTTSNLPLSIQERMSLGLTKLATDGEVLPSASRQFSATDSGKKITFRLDASLIWQDGTNFRPEDVNYSLKGAQVEKTADSLIIQVPSSYAPLPAILSQPLFKVGTYRRIAFLPGFLNRLLFPSALIGLGEYRLTDISYNGRFISELAIKSQKTGEVLTYKFYPTRERAAAALKLGQINSLIGLIDTSEFADNPFFDVSARTVLNQEAILFFNLDDPLLEEKSIRQALIYALPDSFSQGKPTDTPLPETSWARSTLVKKYPQNLDLAKEILEDVATRSAEEAVDLRLSVNPSLLPTALEIASDWEKVGVNAVIETAETPSTKYQLYLGIVPLPPDPDQYVLWHSTQPGNIARYKSFKVDRLLEEGRQTQDRKIRQQTYSDFQKAITEDAPAAFLFYPTVYDVKRKY